MSRDAAARKWVLLLLLSLIWGSSYILIKKGLTGFGYQQAVAIRLVTAGLVCAPPAFFYGRRLSPRKLGWLWCRGCWARSYRPACLVWRNSTCKAQWRAS